MRQNLACTQTQHEFHKRVTTPKYHVTPNDKIVRVFWGRFRLRWRSAPVTNFKAMQHYDWLQNGFFSSWGLHYGQDFSGGELQAWKENDMDAIMATILARGVLWKSSFLENLKSLDMKFGLQRTPTLGVPLLLFFILFVIPTVASNNLVLGKNYWLIGALLHCSLNLWKGRADC